jgi:predicted DNA-binding ribbon-helix-helix protein
MKSPATWKAAPSARPPETQVAGEVTSKEQKHTLEIQNKTKNYKSNIVSIRFDEGDYERLKEIAQEQGTNGAALIRKAVKDIIREADKP